MLDSQPGETGRQYDEEENEYDFIDSQPMEVDEGEDALGAVGGASAGQNICEIILSVVPTPLTRCDIARLR